MSFAGDESDVSGVPAYEPGDQLDGGGDPFVAVAGRRQGRTDRAVQAAQGLVDKGDAEVRGVAEVAVEGRRGDADRAGHLAQPQAAQALPLQEAEGGVQERLTGLLFLGLPYPGGVTHAIQ
jgi:hypothetical protein